MLISDIFLLFVLLVNISFKSIFDWFILFWCLLNEMYILIVLLLFVSKTSCLIYRDEIVVSTKEIEQINENENPYSPFVQCDFL
jgi:hypothetical protein